MHCAWNTNTQCNKKGRIQKMIKKFIHVFSIDTVILSIVSFIAGI